MSLLDILFKIYFSSLKSYGAKAKFDTWGEAALHGVSPLAGNLYAK